MSFLSRLKRNMGKEEEKQDEDSEGEEITESKIKKIKVQSAKKAKPMEKKTKAEKISKVKKSSFSLKKLGGPEGELAVDVYQTAKDIVIEAAIAGVDSDELEVCIENDTVIIKGERGGCSQEEEKSYFYQECYWGAFQRKIILPEEVDASRGTAELKKGILCVRIPKTERKKRRKIDIKE